MISAYRNGFYRFFFVSLICLACVEGIILVIYLFDLASGVFNFNYGVSKYIVKYDPTSKEVETIEPRYDGELNTVRITPPLTDGRFSNSTGIIQLFKNVKYAAKNYVLTGLDFDNNIFNVTISISCEDFSSNDNAVRYLSVGDYSSYQFVPGFHYKIPLRMSGKAKSCVASKSINGFSLNTDYYEGEMEITTTIENQEITFYCLNDKSETNRVTFNISSLKQIPLDSLHGLKVNEWKWINKNTEMNCALINPNNNHYTKITERYLVQSLISGNENDFKNGRSYNGYIKIDETNKYLFRITTGYGSGVYLRINRNYVIRGCPVSIDGVYDSLNPIDLNKGIHEIEIFYYNMNGIKKDIVLEWKKISESDYKVIDNSYYYISPNTILSYDKEIISVNMKESNVIVKPIIYNEDIKVEKYISKPSMKSIGLNIDEKTGIISGNISSLSVNEKEYTIVAQLSDGKEISCIIHINIVNNNENKDVVAFNIVESVAEVKEEEKKKKNNKRLLEIDEHAEEEEEISSISFVRKVKGINMLLYNHYDILDNNNITIEAENAEIIRIYNSSNNEMIYSSQLQQQREEDEENDDDDMKGITYDIDTQLLSISECGNYKIDAQLGSNHYYLYLQCENIEEGITTTAITCKDSKKMNISSGNNDTLIKGSISNGIYLYPTMINKERNLVYCIPSDLLMYLHFESEKQQSSNNNNDLIVRVNDEEILKTVPTSSVLPFTYLLDVRRGKTDAKCSDIYGIKRIKMPTQNFKLVPLCVPSKDVFDCIILPNTNGFSCDAKTGIITTVSKTKLAGNYSITLKYYDTGHVEHSMNSILSIELNDEVDDYYPLRDLKFPLSLGNFINGKRSDTELIMEGNAKECIGENLPYGMSLRLRNGIYTISGNPIFLDSNNYTMNIVCRNDLSESYKVNYTYYILNDYARGIRGLLYNNNNEEVRDVVLQISNKGIITLPPNVTRGSLNTYLNLGEFGGEYRIKLTSGKVSSASYLINDKVYIEDESIYISQYASLVIEFELTSDNNIKRILQEERANDNTITLEIRDRNSQTVTFDSTSLVCNPKEVDISTVDVRYDGNIFRFPILTNTRISPINTNDEISRIVDCSLVNSVNVSNRITVDKNCDVVINSPELGSYPLVIQPFTMVRECKIVEILVEIRSCNEAEPNMVEYTLSKEKSKENDVAYIISPNHVVVAKINANEKNPVHGIECLPNGVYKTKGKAEFVINGYKFTDSLKTIEVNDGSDVIIGENQIIYYSLDKPSNSEWYLPSVNVKDWNTILGNETVTTTKNEIYFKTDYILENQNSAISSFIVEIDNKYPCAIYVNGIKLYSQEKVEAQYNNRTIKVIPPNEILHLNGINAIGIEFHSNTNSTTDIKLYNPNLKIVKSEENNGNCLDITASLTNKNKKMNVNANITNIKEGETIDLKKIDLSKLFRNDVSDYNGITFNSTTPVSLLISYQDIVRFPISNFGFDEVEQQDREKKILAITGVVIYGYSNDTELKDNNGKLLLSDLSIPTYSIDATYFTNLSSSITNNSYKYYNITFYHNNDDVFTLNRVFFTYCLPITCPGFDEYNRSEIYDIYNISNIYYEDDYQLNCGNKKWGMTGTRQIQPIRNFKYDFSEYTVIKSSSDNSEGIIEIPYSIIPSYDGIIRKLECKCSTVSVNGNVDNGDCKCDSTSSDSNSKDNTKTSYILFDEKSGRISEIKLKEPSTNGDLQFSLEIYEEKSDVILQTLTINVVDKFDGCPGDEVWPITKVGERIKLPCVDGMIGYRYRRCQNDNKWSEIDKTNCRKPDDSENKTNIVQFEYNVTVSTENTDFDSLFDKIRSELLYRWRDEMFNEKPLELIAPNVEDIKIEYIQPEIRQLSTTVELKVTLFVEIEPTTTKDKISGDYKSKLDKVFTLMKGDGKPFISYVYSSYTDALYSPTSLTYCKELKPYYNETCQESNEKWIIKQFEVFELKPEDNMYYHYNKYDEIKYSIVIKPNEKKDRKVSLNDKGIITIDSTLPGSNSITIKAETSKGSKEYILNYEIVEKKCIKDGYWNETEIGKTITKNCTDGYIGIEYRQCNEDGEWNDVDRDSCIYSNEQSKPAKGDDVFIKIEVTYTNNPSQPERILRELEEKLSFEDYEVRDAYKRKLSELSGIDINDISIEQVTGNSFVLVIRANAKNNKDLSEKVMELVNSGEVINELKKEDIRYSDLETKADNVKYETVDGVYDEPVVREDPDYSLKDGALAGVIIASILGAIVVVLLVFIGVRCYLDNKRKE